VYLSCNAKVITVLLLWFGSVNVQEFSTKCIVINSDWFLSEHALMRPLHNRQAPQRTDTVHTSAKLFRLQLRLTPSRRENMSASQIPNLLTSRGRPRSRAGRGRRGGGSGSQLGNATPAQQRKDIDIQSTDTDAAVSRLSAVSLGYLDDPFTSYFVSGAGTRRLPIINRGTTFLYQAASCLTDALSRNLYANLRTRYSNKCLSFSS